MTEIQELVLNLATKIVDDGDFPSNRKIRARIDGPKKPSYWAVDEAIRSLKHLDLFPETMTRSQVNALGHEKRRANQEAKIVAQPIVEAPAPPKAKRKKRQYLGPFAEDMRRLARLRRKGKAKP